MMNDDNSSSTTTSDDSSTTSDDDFEDDDPRPQAPAKDQFVCPDKHVCPEVKAAPPKRKCSLFEDDIMPIKAKEHNIKDNMKAPPKRKDSLFEDDTVPVVSSKRRKSSIMNPKSPLVMSPLRKRKDSLFDDLEDLFEDDSSSLSQTFPQRSGPQDNIRLSPSSPKTPKTPKTPPTPKETTHLELSREDSLRDFRSKARRSSLTGGSKVAPSVETTYHIIHTFEMRTLIGHASRVKCIAMAPQEKQFGSCSNEDTTVTMQDFSTGRAIASFLGHEDQIICATFSSDYRFLATASRDNTMILWDVITATQLLTYEHEKVVICCAFSRDSKSLVSGCQDKICRIWDTKKGRQIISFGQHENIVIAVSCSPVEDLICSASADKTIRLWTSKGQCRHTMIGHLGPVLTCSFNSSGTHIISNDEKDVKVWKSDTGECIMTANVDTYVNTQMAVGVKKIAWTLSAYCPGKFGHYIVVATSTRSVVVLDPDTGDEVLSVLCRAPVCCLSSGVCSQMAFGDSFGNVYVMSLT